MRPATEHRPDERPHHVAQERVGGDLELEQRSALAPAGGEDVTPEDRVLGVGRGEGAEVVLARQERGATGQPLQVERRRVPEGLPVLEG